MKNLFIGIFTLSLIGGLWVLLAPKEMSTTDAPYVAVDNIKNPKSSAQTNGSSSPDEGLLDDKFAADDDALLKESFKTEQLERPADEIYRNASEALSAVKQGAKNFYDIILEQFVALSDQSCAWCPEFYGGIKQELNNPLLSENEKSYFAEILAISGRVGEVMHLLSLAKEGRSPEESALYLEALEISIGNEDLVKALNSELQQDQPDGIKESVVTAITNQGSSLAVESLYQHLRQMPDKEYYYQQGTGPGEIVPQPEALSKIKEFFMARDELSSLAAKDLIHGGVEGLQILREELARTNDPADKQFLEDAYDHINLDDENKEYLEKVVQEESAGVFKDFAEEALKRFE